MCVCACVCFVVLMQGRGGATSFGTDCPPLCPLCVCPGPAAGGGGGAQSILSFFLGLAKANFVGGLSPLGLLLLRGKRGLESMAQLEVAPS